MAKILIAEDDKVTRNLIVSIVEKAGYTAIQSTNGRVAFTILNDNPDIDVLITDVMMPEMTGRELVQVIRQKSELDHISTIIISGVVGVNEISDLLDQGASVFCPKPISPGILTDYIHRSVRKSLRAKGQPVAT